MFFIGLSRQVIRRCIIAADTKSSAAFVRGNVACCVKYPSIKMGNIVVEPTSEPKSVGEYYQDNTSKVYGQRYKQVYVIECSQGKWYVGSSLDPQKRYECHLNGKGSAWTKKYHPVRLCEIINIEGNFTEDNVTKTYMQKYGIDNVRGGSYCSVNLSLEQKSMLSREIKHAENLCFKCGGVGHYCKDCDTNTVAKAPQEKRYTNKLLCSRCERNNHTVNQCFAKTKLDGTKL